MADPSKQPKFEEASDDEDPGSSSDETLVTPEAEISHDSELMTLHVAAVPVPSSRQFSTHRDKNDKPFIISCGNDGHLYAIKESHETGQRKLVDLSDAFGLDPEEDDVISFESVQDPDDDRIFLTFVTMGEEDKTNLNICRPFHPQEINVDLDEGKLDLKEQMIPHKNKNKRITLTKVWIGPKTPEFHYPEIVIAYKSPAEINGASDVARVKVTENFSSFDVMSDFEIPEDASGVDDIVPATTAVGRGYFCLYTLQGEQRLIFATTDKLNGYGFKVPLTCPPQAKALATYRDPETGKSCLVVGADGLFVWNPTEAIQQGHPGKQITAGDDFFDVTQMHVTQYGTLLSIFATNEAQGVIYGHCKDLEFKEPLKAVPLVPDFAGGCFSPFVAADGNTQQLLVAGKGGVLSLLEQDGVTLAWKDQPFYIPNMNANIEYPGYMINIVVEEKDSDTPLVNAVLRLRSSGYDHVIVNGRNMFLGPEGLLVRTDEMGQINMMVASDDIACDVYYVENPGDEDYPELLPAGEVITIDPAEKVWKRLAEIKNGKDLKNFKTSSGKPLDFDGKLSDEDMEELAAAISAASSERGKRLENGDYIDGPAVTDGSADDDPGAFPITKNAIKEVDSFKDAIQLGLDGFKWLIKKAKQLVKFVVRKTVHGLDILLETKVGGKFRFLINGLKSAAMFIGAVLEGFLDVLDKIVDFVGYLLDFEGAKIVQKSIMHIFNEFMLQGPEVINKVADATDRAIESFKQGVKKKTYPIDALVAEHQQDIKIGATEKGKNGPKVSKASAGNNYTEYQMRHGGGEEGARDLDDAPDGNPIDDTLTAAINDLLVPVMNSLGDMMEKNVENFRLLFNKNDNLNFGEVLQKMGADVLLGLLDLLQKLVVGLLRVVAGLLKDFVDGINGRIFVPVISPLWKRLTGSDLTVLSVISLLLAIPTNAMIKTISGDPDIDLDFTKDDFFEGQLGALATESFDDLDDEDDDTSDSEDDFGEDDDDGDEDDEDDEDDNDNDDNIPEGLSIASLAQSQLGALADISIARSQLASPPQTPRSSLHMSPTANRQSLGPRASASMTPKSTPGSVALATSEVGGSAEVALNRRAVSSNVTGPRQLQLAPAKFAGARTLQNGRVVRSVSIVGAGDDVLSIDEAIVENTDQLVGGGQPLFPIGALSPIDEPESASATESETEYGLQTSSKNIDFNSMAGVRTTAGGGGTGNGNGQISEKANEESGGQLPLGTSKKSTTGKSGSGDDGCNGEDDCGCPEKDPTIFPGTEMTDIRKAKAKFQACIGLFSRLAICYFKVRFGLKRIAKPKPLGPGENPKPTPPWLKLTSRSELYANISDREKGQAKYWKFRDALTALILAVFTIPYHSMGAGRMPRESDFDQEKILDVLLKFKMCQKREKPLEEKEAQLEVDAYESKARALVKVRKLRFASYAFRALSPVLGLVLFTFSARPEIGAVKDMGMGIVAFIIKAVELAKAPREDGDNKASLMRRRWALASMGLVANLGFSICTLVGIKQPYVSVPALGIGTGVHISATILQFHNTLQGLSDDDGEEVNDEL
ncbi:hypothetical protein MKZ38_008823 [Zalerion maritima]|uniref:Uncharacterized protein n=1 Tax=Zalerion maritima TaxID=339359 RepID=A0AAD5RU05_9PEZI|nr:hypothetical protein MKZ38_008823 [Zalerion maritima]